MERDSDRLGELIEQTEDTLDAMRAFREEKPVQIIHLKTWEDISDPNFHGLCRYRRKPEPGYVWIRKDINGSPVATFGHAVNMDLDAGMGVDPGTRYRLDPEE